MKANEIQEYPVFQANQILTNTQLNNLIHYFDQEIKQSRLQISGQGILYGLSLDISTAEIKLGCGHAITSEGYLLGTTEELVFDKAQQHIWTNTPENSRKPFEKYLHTHTGLTEAWELFTNTKQPQIGIQNLTSLALNWAEYQFLMYLDAPEEDLKSCTGTNCDNKGKTKKFKIRFFLIKKPIPIKNTEINAAPFTLNRLQSALVADNKHMGNLVSSKQLKHYYSKVIEENKTLLINALDSFYQKYQEDFQLRESDWTTIKNFLSVPMAGHQYVYALLKDIADTYDEMLEYAISVQSDNCTAIGNFPQHINIGLCQPLASLIVVDTVRHYYQPKPTHNEPQQQIHFLFHKIQVLVSNFEKDPNLAYSITPSACAPVSLQKRSLPSYYQKDRNSVKQHWNYQLYRKSQYNQINNYREFPKNMSYDLRNSPFLLVEGILNQDVDEICQFLEKQKLTHNLSFGVVAVELMDLGVFDHLSSQALMNGKWGFDELFHKTKETIEYWRGTYNHKLRKKSQNEWQLFFDRFLSSTAFADLDLMYQNTRLGLLMKYQELNYQIQNIGIIYTINQNNFLGAKQVYERVFNQLREIYLILGDHLHELAPNFVQWYQLHKELLNSLIQLRLLVTHVVEEEIGHPSKGVSVEKLLKQLAEAERQLDIILLDDNYLKLNNLYHNFFWRMDYYAHQDPTIFSNFARKYTGLEHQTGVPSGGTLVLVYETQANQSRTIVADFCLPHLCINSPCEVPVSHVVRPPIARPNYQIVKQTKNTQNQLGWEVLVEVHKNDFDPTLMKNFSIDIVQHPTIGKAEVKIKNKKIVGIHYQLVQNDFEGFVSFTYKYTCQETHLSDTATVTLLLVRGKVLEALDDVIRIAGKRDKSFFDFPIIGYPILEKSRIINIPKNEIKITTDTSLSNISGENMGNIMLIPDSVGTVHLGLAESKIGGVEKNIFFHYEMSHEDAKKRKIKSNQARVEIEILLWAGDISLKVKKEDNSPILLEDWVIFPEDAQFQLLDPSSQKPLEGNIWNSNLGHVELTFNDKMPALNFKPNDLFFEPTNSLFLQYRIISRSLKINDIGNIQLESSIQPETLKPHRFFKVGPVVVGLKRLIFAAQGPESNSRAGIVNIIDASKLSGTLQYNEQKKEFTYLSPKLMPKGRTDHFTYMADGKILGVGIEIIDLKTPPIRPIFPVRPIQ
jgi:hypothetical protein